MNTWTRAAAVTAVLGAAIALPFTADTYTAGTGARILAVGVLAIAVHQLSATARLASLGHAAYFGIGAYLTAIITHLGMDRAPAHLVIAATAGGLAAAAAGAALVRLRGLLYVMATLALGVLAATAAATWTTVTGGTDGLTSPPPVLWPGLSPLDGAGQRYLWCLAVTVVVCAVVVLRARSPFGAAMTAIGDTELRTRAIGYPVGQILIRAHAVSGAVAGVGGALWIHATGYIAPTDLGLATSAIALAAATIGHRHGPLIVIGATGLLIAARDVAASHLPTAGIGHGPVWLGLLLIMCAFAPLLRKEARA